MATLDWIKKTIDPVLGWTNFPPTNAMPINLAKKLRSFQTSLDALVPKKDALEKQIKRINDATEAAESLPADMQSLKEAQEDVSKILQDASSALGQIQAAHKHITEASANISQHEEAAKKLVAQTEDAYRIATSKGLAGAFDQRARRLGWSMWAWVAGLLSALLIAAFVGAHRIDILSEALQSDNPNWEVVGMHVSLTALSITAPIWFAWLATKQIGQRFRLAEDYWFKASVAKAYEGYRKEAARIDSAFEARLFSSALARLEEAPLRLVENVDHGSPWHELFSSKEFQRAINQIPELHEKYIDLAKDAFKGTRDFLPKNKGSADANG